MKALRKLDKPNRERIAKVAQLLRINPHPPTAKHLIGTEGIFRIRTGDWRLLYTVCERELIVLIVLIVKVGHRSDVYRGV